MKVCRTRSLYFIPIVALVALCLFVGRPALGVVLHDDSQQAPNSMRPDDAVVGQWRHNASCVVIAPNHVITTRHQGVSINSTLVIGGETYYVEEIRYHGTADLVIARIKQENGQPANLTTFAEAYQNTDEDSSTVAIGGFGNIRAEEPLKKGNTPYGYAWETNRDQRWGRNVLDGHINNYEMTSWMTWYSDVLRLHFDATGSANHIDYEAAVAEWDSGGGWFVQDGDDWKVVALSAYAQHAAQKQTWFSPADYNYGIRLSSYYSWIIQYADPWETPFGDATYDGIVGASDLSRLAANWGKTDMGWAKGDFNADTLVGAADLAILAAYWGTDNTGGGGLEGDGFTSEGADFGGGAVPEPTTLSLLLLAVAPLIRRRPSI